MQFGVTGEAWLEVEDVLEGGFDDVEGAGGWQVLDVGLDLLQFQLEQLID